MIFISHNYKDKGIIEPIALRLSKIFGKEKVFYDSWSIQPGDGIIDKMIDGKLDQCLMPPILFQSLYIDLFGNGLDVAIRQIVDVTSGTNTFNPGAQEFSNLRANFYQEEEKVVIECHAEYYLEPISSFLVLVDNKENEVLISCQASTYTSGAFQEVELNR